MPASGMFHALRAELEDVDKSVEAERAALRYKLQEVHVTYYYYTHASVQVTLMHTSYLYCKVNASRAMHACWKLIDVEGSLDTAKSSGCVAQSSLALPL